MTSRGYALWFRWISVVSILFGLLFVFFGLKVFSEVVKLIPPKVLLPWESALYGAVMVGWGMTLLLVGRIAFQRKDAGLKKALFVGLLVWLAIEAVVSAWFGVWFNVGVDFAVLFLFGVPLLRK